VREPVQPMPSMENLCLRPHGSCGCGETDVKPKMMMIPPSLKLIYNITATSTADGNADHNDRSQVNNWCYSDKNQQSSYHEDSVSITNLINLKPPRHLQFGKPSHSQNHLLKIAREYVNLILYPTEDNLLAHQFRIIRSPSSHDNTAVNTYSTVTFRQNRPKDALDVG